MDKRVFAIIAIFLVFCSTLAVARKLEEVEDNQVCMGRLFMAERKRERERERVREIVLLVLRQIQ